jgi:putative component of toxin-antitoxin plasmid stabilization module
MVVILDRSEKGTPTDVVTCSYAVFDLASEPVQGWRYVFGRTEGVAVIDFGVQDDLLQSARRLYAVTVDDSQNEPPDIVTDDDFEI